MSVFNNYFGNKDSHEVKERFDDSPPVHWKKDDLEELNADKYCDSSLTIKLEGNPEFTKDLEEISGPFDLTGISDRLTRILNSQKFLTYSDVFFAVMEEQDDSASEFTGTLQDYCFLLGDKYKWRAWIKQTRELTEKEADQVNRMVQETMD